MLGKTAANLQAAEANRGAVPYILVIRNYLPLSDRPSIHFLQGSLGEDRQEF